MIEDFSTAAFERALLEKAARLKINCDIEELRLAEAVAQRARQIVAPHRQSGQTEESIHVEHGDGGAEVHGRNPYLEFGTVNMAPAPFMRPAIAEAPGHFKHPDFH